MNHSPSPARGSRSRLSRWRARAVTFLAATAATLGAGVVLPSAADAGYYFTYVCRDGYGNDGVFFPALDGAYLHNWDATTNCNAGNAGWQGLQVNVVSTNADPGGEVQTPRNTSGWIGASSTVPNAAMIRWGSSAGRMGKNPVPSGWYPTVMDPTQGWCVIQGARVAASCADANDWGREHYDITSYNNRWYAGDYPARYGVTMGGTNAHGAIYFGTVCNGDSSLNNNHCYRVQHREAAGVSITDAHITNVDNTPPTISAIGGAAADGKWHKPGPVQLSLTGWDNTGIRAFSLQTAGGHRAEIAQACNWGRLRPCEDRVLDTTVPLPANTSGLEHVTVAAWDATTDTVDPSLNAAATSIAVKVDGLSPAAPVTTDPAPGWKRVNDTFALNAPLPSSEQPAGLHSPIVKREVRVCPQDDPDATKCVVSERPATGTIASVAYGVPREGRWTTEVRLTDEVGNVGAWSAPRPALLDTTAPVIAAEGLSKSVKITATDQLSGMTGGNVKYRVDSDTEWVTVADKSEIVVPLSGGAHTIELQATDAAGNTTSKDGGKTGEIINITVTDPDASAPGVEVIPGTPTDTNNGGDGTNTHTHTEGAAGTDRGQIVVIDRGAWNGTNASENAKLDGWYQKTSAKKPKIKAKGLRAAAAPKKKPSTKKDSDNFKSSGIKARVITANQRPVLRGRLVNEKGQGIGNARLDLLAQIPGGTTVLDKGGVRTRPDGNWTLVLPKDQTSRTLIIGYRSRINDEKAIATTTLKLTVKAKVSLYVGRAKVGGKTRFSGSISKRYIGSAGIPVALQYRKGGRWQTFATAKADSTGKWKTTYRFTQRAKYQMRAFVASTDGYAYKGGPSKARTVTVR